MILCTDMKRHFKDLTLLNNRINMADFDPKKKDQ
jgi:hypothetical protein